MSLLTGLRWQTFDTKFRHLKIFIRTFSMNFFKLAMSVVRLCSWISQLGIIRWKNFNQYRKSLLRKKFCKPSAWFIVLASSSLSMIFSRQSKISAWCEYNVSTHLVLKYHLVGAALGNLILQYHLMSSHTPVHFGDLPKNEEKPCSLAKKFRIALFWLMAF